MNCAMTRWTVFGRIGQVITPFSLGLSFPSRGGFKVRVECFGADLGTSSDTMVNHLFSLFIDIFFINSDGFS